MSKQFTISVPEEQFEMWQKTLPLTEYNTMSAFIRDIMRMVCECVNDMTKEVLIWVSDIDDDEDEDQEI